MFSSQYANQLKSTLKVSAASKSEVMEPNKLYIGNLHARVTSQDLKIHFSKIVPVTHAIVIQDKLTGRSRGKGYVTCKEESDVYR